MSYNELIERVKPRPEIWQQAHPLFKNKMVRIKFWHRLAKELKTDESQLKKNWKYLTDQFRKEYKKLKAHENVSGVSVKSGWAYYDALAFLKPGVVLKQERPDKRPVWVAGSSDSDNNESTQKPTQTTPVQYVSFQNDTNDENSRQNNSQTKPTKKASSITKADLILRKLQSLNATIMQSQPDMFKDDEDCMFFMSILPMVRNLSPVKKLQLRGKINDWLLETMSEREDPLNSVSQYALVGDVEEEDNKEALKEHLMAIGNDDDD